MVLRRMRDALVRLPDSALGQHYFEIPGDCLASPRTSHIPFPGPTGHPRGRNVMAAPPRGRALSGREEAIAREVAALLEPVLAEMDRKLDSLLQKVNELLAQLGVDGVHALLTRLEAATEAVQCGGTHDLGGDQEQ